MPSTLATIVKKDYNMKHIRIFTLAVLAAVAVAASAQTKVVDADSNEPVAFASVFNDETQTRVGLTDTDGKLPEAAAGCKKISIQHINYGSKSFDMDSTDNAVIRMKSVTYQVPEVTVNKEKGDYLRIKTFVKQYTLLNGKPANVCQYNCNLYFSKDDPEKMPKCNIISQRLLEDKSAFEGQKMMLKAFAENNDPVYLSTWTLSKLYDKIKEAGRYYVDDDGKMLAVLYLRENPQQKKCEIVLDSCFNEKPFSVPLFGISINNLYDANTHNTESGKPELANIVNKVTMFRIVHNKSKGYTDMVTEYYPQEVDYATKAEYKAERKEKLKAFTVPEGVPPFNANIERAMKTMTLK